MALRLTADELETYHADRRERSSKNNKPGIADSLITMAAWPEHGPVQLDKRDLVSALAKMWFEELESTPPGEKERLYERRPILGFVVRRIAPAVFKSHPLS